jgi:hypothetical protein
VADRQSDERPIELMHGEFFDGWAAESTKSSIEPFLSACWVERRFLTADRGGVSESHAVAFDDDDVGVAEEATDEGGDEVAFHELTVSAQESATPD